MKRHSIAAVGALALSVLWISGAAQARGHRPPSKTASRKSSGSARSASAPAPQMAPNAQGGSGSGVTYGGNSQNAVDQSGGSAGQTGNSINGSGSGIQKGVTGGSSQNR